MDSILGSGIFEFCFETCCIWKKKLMSAIRIIVKTVTGSFPLSWQDGIGDNLLQCRIDPYLSQSGITIGGKLYKVDADKYTLLDSINGNGYIKTGIHANPSITNAKMRVAVTDTSGTTALFGTRVGTSSSTKSYNIFGAVSGSSGRFDNVNPSHPFAFTVNQWYDIELGHNGLKGTVTINGELVNTGAQNMNNSDCGEIYIGCLNNNGTAFVGSTPSKWGIVEIYADGTNLTGYFYPAKRNSDNAVGMVNIIDGTWHGTESGGSFTAGKTTKTIEVQTENMFDPANKKYNGHTIGSSSGSKQTTNNRCINVLGWLSAGNYIICSTTDTLGGYLHKYSEEGTDDDFSGWEGAITLPSSVHSGELYCKSFTLTERCFCRGVSSASLANSGNIMLISGTVNPSAFIPYLNGTMEVPICSVERSGRKMANLFDPSDADTRYPNGWYSSGSATANAPTLNRTIILPCSEGDIFTFKHYTQESGARYFWIYSDTIAVGEPCSIMYGDMIGANAITTTPAPSNAKYIGICFWRSTAGTVQSAADDFVIVKGSTAPTEHIPYGYEYKLIESCQGRVDLGTLSNWRRDETTRAADGATIHAFYVSIPDLKRVGQSITGGLYMDGMTAQPVSIVDYGGDTVVMDDIIGGADNNGNFWLYDKELNDCSTAEIASRLSGKILYYQRTTDAEFIQPQVVKHYSTMMQGKIDLVTGLESEGFNCVEFDGTESVTKLNAGSNNIYWIMLCRESYTAGFYTIFSSHFKYYRKTLSNIQPGECSCYSYDGNDIKIFFGLDVSTVAEAKAVLAALKASGNPVKVWFPKATPTTSQGTAHTIQGHTGLVTVDCIGAKTGEIKYNSRSVGV